MHLGIGAARTIDKLGILAFLAIFGRAGPPILSPGHKVFHTLHRTQDFLWKY